MPPLFDASLCTRCGLCSRICVFGRIAPAGDGTPSVVGGAACVGCGHCVAVCPTGAVSLPGAGAPPAVAASAGAVTSEALAGYMQGRRSIRRYLEKPVDRRLFEEIFEIVRFAPTALNRQPIGWTIVSGTGPVRALAALAADWLREIDGGDPLYHTILEAWEKGTDLICHGAPHLVVAHAPADDPLAPRDAAIACAHLDLALPAFGLGGCWAGLFTTAASSHPPLAEALRLPAGHLPLGTLLVGYPVYRYASVPPRKRPALRWL